MEIDVIIPLYKPDKRIFDLLDKLQKQTQPVQNIILMNTEEIYFQKITKGIDFFAKYPNIKVYHLSKQEFDHGNTRRKGVEYSHAPVFVMMTQDAMPADVYLLEKLITHLGEEKVAAAYARQLPDEDCNIEERLSRAFNYPEQSLVKSKDDLERMGIKTYFCSNVCAAYRRDVYDELGGFVKKTIFNEDMIYAAGAIEKGYKVAYEAEAKVVHSHNYTNMQQLKRNFDLGVSQVEYAEIFDAVPSEGEGKKMVASTTKYLLHHGMILRLPHFYLQCASKYTGYLLGKNYRKLPKKLVLALTSNKEYFSK
ncbi:MAG: glycosyltransferase family 2 protein [Acetatifactor sp.]|jgi:rhamnosyltransferase|nr:glycosyltransferase family 2 protein [Acetatifactor sp.]